MTLVASFYINDRPYVIGDVMLSTIGIEREHRPLPTYDNVAEILPIEWQRSISGIHRKVAFINAQFIVGWTGKLIYAGYFINKLTEFAKPLKYQDKKIIKNILDKTKKSLEEYAEKYSFEDEDLSIIGIFKDKHGIFNQFIWTHNDLTFYKGQNNLALGTGAEDFYEVFNGMENDEVKINTQTNMKCLSIVSLLLGEEFATGENIKLLYGGGYDIIFYKSGQFSFMDDILYIPVILEDMDKSLGKVINPNVFFKYYYIDGNLAIARKILVLDSSGKAEKDELTISLIGKFGDSKNTLEKLNADKCYKFNSHVVSLIFITKVNGNIIYAPFISLTKDKSHIMFFDNGIAINEKVFKLVIPKISSQIKNK